MRVAGVILMAVGLALTVTAVATWHTGMKDTFSRFESSEAQPSPADLARGIQTVTASSYQLGAAGLLFLLTGAPLLIVGISRAAGKEQEGAPESRRSIG